jgi:hypothetical protein
MKKQLSPPTKSPGMHPLEIPPAARQQKLVHRIIQNQTAHFLLLAFQSVVSEYLIAA